MGDSDLAVQDSERHGLTKGMGAASFLVIWVVMMIAMMFPTAAPMILVYERVQRDRHSSERAFTPTWAFVGAYLLMWALFGVLAYLGSLAASGLAQEIPWIMMNAARIGGGILVLAGKWCYLYRAIDGDGNLVDSMLSEKRNMDAAKRFFQQVLQTVGHAPERVTTDRHASSPRAIREMLGSDVVHLTNHYLNNRLEQDHRGINQRSYPMRGFGTFPSALRFCRAFDEVHQFFRVSSIMRTKDFFGATTRDVPSTIGSFESPGAGGVTPMHVG